MTRLRRAIFIRIVLSQSFDFVPLALAWYHIEQLLARTQYLLFDILSQVSICSYVNVYHLCTISVPARYHTPQSPHRDTPHTVPSQCCSLFGLLYIYTLSTHTCRATWVRVLPRLLSVCVHTYILSFLFVSSTCCITQHDPPCSTRRVVDTQTPRRPRGLVLLVLLRRSQLYLYIFISIVLII